MWKKREWIDNNIGESGATMISEALKHNNTLTELYLDRNDWKRMEERKDEKEQKGWIDNYVGESGTRMLSEALKCNSNLTVMDLHDDKYIMMIFYMKKGGGEEK